MTTDPDQPATIDPDLAPPDATAGTDYPPEMTLEAERELAGPTKAMPAPIPNPEVNLAVPFIHQLWDTPDEFYGLWACGPTSTAMALAYYQALEPHPITVSAPPGMAHESLFGWYVSNAFSHRGKTFDTAAGTPRGGWAQGIYGAVVARLCNGGWCAGAANIQSVLNHFLKPLGNTARFAYRKDTSPERIKSVLMGGHPVIASGKLFQLDHLIVIRGCFDDAGTTRWIVNDPFGYQADRSFDGGNVVYDWDEINLKWMVWLDGPHRP
jgi:hypothetical protein